jgi:hypothetical protein
MKYLILTVIAMINIYSTSFAIFPTTSKRFMSTVKKITYEQELASIIMKQELVCNLAQSTTFRKIATIEKSNKKVRELYKTSQKTHHNIHSAWAHEKATISKHMQKFNNTLNQYLKKHEELERLEEALLISKQR